MMRMWQWLALGHMTMVAMVNNASGVCKAFLK